MPSKRKNKTTSRPTRKINHHLFWPLLILVFILWLLYRLLFSFSVIFDEFVGKSIFFAFPVLIYIAITNWPAIMDTFSARKLRSGLLIGLAMAGIFGFSVAILAALRHGVTVQPVPVFMAEYFWWELFLAFITSFFETLFFFSFVMMVIIDRYRHWSQLRQVAVVALIFLIFHLPNLLLRFSGQAILWQILLLFSLAFGEGILFLKWRNAYVLVVIQAIWGMVLLLHF